MSQYYRALTTLAPVGLRTFSPGFLCVGYRITVAGRFGGGDPYDHTSIGGSDGTRQHVVSTFNDATGRTSMTTTAKVVSHYERVGGVITEVLSATHDSFQPTGPRINITISNVNYQVIIEAWD